MATPSRPLNSDSPLPHDPKARRKLEKIKELVKIMSCHQLVSAYLPSGLKICIRLFPESATEI